MPKYGTEMPEQLSHRYMADFGMRLWAANQRLVFLDEEIEEVRQHLRNLQRRRDMQFHEVTKAMESYYDIRRDNATPE